MSTSTLQLLPTSASDISQLDPATLASIPGVTYDLKRLKVYSSCLRCRAKKVKCDRKEPCSRCEKHEVECSYRELASVQLDIRQFQKHLTNPRIRKDGAGIITSTATPIITLPSGDTAVLSPSTTAAATLIAAAKATASTSNSSDSINHNRKSGSNHSSSNSNSSININHANKSHTHRKSTTTSSTSTPTSPVNSVISSKLASGSSSSTDTDSDAPAHGPTSKASAIARARVHKVHRRKASNVDVKDRHRFQVETEVVEDSDEDEEIERLVLRDDSASYARRYLDEQTDVEMSSDGEEGYGNTSVPIWRAQAVGKHKQTLHEQDMAETFGLAAYLKSKEMDTSMAGQAIDYDMELERALVQRMPTSFSRPDRSLSRARKYAQAGYNPALPYSRPSYCQLSSYQTQTVMPVAAHCCCQIAARQGQAPGTCYFSGNTKRNMSYDESSMSPQSQTIGYDQGEATRIAYSPSYQPSYTPKVESQEVDTQALKDDWTSNTSSAMPPLPLAPLRQLDIGSSSQSSLPHTRVELPPIYLPKLPPHPTTPASSDLSKFQVGRDGDKPLEIACKYNEPNVDAWDMIEKPLSRAVPVTTKRGRPAKMEMGWLLS